MSKRIYASSILVAANIIVFVASLMVGVHEQVIDQFAFGRAALLAGKAHVLAASAFLHIDWSHLLYNMLFLLLFGRASEDELGTGRTLLCYGGGVLLGSLFFAALFPARTAVGASGGIFAVMTAVLLIEPGRPVYDTGNTMTAIPLGFLALVYLVPTLLQAFSLAGNTAHIAHLGGAVAGAALAYRWRRTAVRKTVYGLLP